MKQLQKALEKSDSYIEQIEKELEGYRKILKENPNFMKNNEANTENEKSENGHVPSSDSMEWKSEVKTEPTVNEDKTNANSTGVNSDVIPAVRTSVKSTNMDNQYTKTSDISVVLSDVLSPAKNFTHYPNPKPVNCLAGLRMSPNKAQNQVQNARETEAPVDSFELELPSPISASTTLGKTSEEESLALPTQKLNKINDISDISQFNDTKTTTDSLTLETCKKKLKFDSDMSGVSSVNFSEPADKVLPKTVTFNDNLLGSDINQQFQNNVTDDLDLPLDDTDAAEKDLCGMNISLTPEMMDCMKLLNAAEKKVGKCNEKLDMSETWSLSSPSGLNEMKKEVELNVTSSACNKDFLPSALTSDFKMVSSVPAHSSSIPVKDSFYGQPKSDIGLMPPPIMNPSSVAPSYTSGIMGSNFLQASKPYSSGIPGGFGSDMGVSLGNSVTNVPVSSGIHTGTKGPKTKRAKSQNNFTSSLPIQPDSLPPSFAGSMNHQMARAPNTDIFSQRPGNPGDMFGKSLPPGGFSHSEMGQPRMQFGSSALGNPGHFGNKPPNQFSAPPMGAPPMCSFSSTNPSMPPFSQSHFSSSLAMQGQSSLRMGGPMPNQMPDVMSRPSSAHYMPPNGMLPSPSFPDLSRPNSAPGQFAPSAPFSTFNFGANRF